MVKNTIKIIAINILVLFTLLFISDFVLCKIENNRLKPQNQYKYDLLNKIFNPTIHNLKAMNFDNEKSYGDGSSGRKPDGLNFKAQKPIVVFGCSFAYGHYLYQNQTFSYKLANILQKPVYNRAIAGAGPQYAYYQTLTEEFYEEIPKTDTIIFVMIDDHYRRILGEMFSISDQDLNLHYKIINNNLVMDNYKNYLLNYFKHSNTLKFIRHKYKNYYIENPNNAEKMTNDLMLYFIKTRENIEKKWNNKINFYVIFYEEIKHQDMLQKKLKENNFKVIKTSQLTNENLSSEEYKMLDNGHPKESAWNLLTPLIAKELNL